jgi:hypothetical protein
MDGQPRTENFGSSSFPIKMKFLGALFLATAAQAHYTFPQLVAGGSATGAWQYVRKTTNYQSNGPVTDVRYPLTFQEP